MYLQRDAGVIRFYDEIRIAQVVATVKIGVDADVPKVGRMDGNTKVVLSMRSL
jgi:hypothetical protein